MDETTYSYNDADQLTSVTQPGESAISYTWDDNGNLTDRGSDEFAWGTGKWLGDDYRGPTLPEIPCYIDNRRCTYCGFRWHTWSGRGRDVDQWPCSAGVGLVGVATDLRDCRNGSITACVYGGLGVAAVVLGPALPWWVDLPANAIVTGSEWAHSETNPSDTERGRSALREKNP